MKAERYETIRNETEQWRVNKFRVYFIGEVQNSKPSIYTYSTTMLVPKVENKIKYVTEGERS